MSERQQIAEKLYGYNAYIEKLWIPDPSAPYESAVKWNDEAALTIADAILALRASAPSAMTPTGDDDEENDLVWRLLHPLWSHGPTGPAHLDRYAAVSDMRQAAAEIQRLSAPLPSTASSDEPSHVMCIGWPTIRRLQAGEAVWFDDIQAGAVAADDLLEAVPLGSADSSRSDAMTAAPATDEVREIVDLYFAPWGAAKGARWEALSGDQPFNAEVAMHLIADALPRHEGGAP